MLKNKRQNVHHSKLPQPGALGFIRGLRGAVPSAIDPCRRCMAMSTSQAIFH
jgi:hypothetical protein